MLLCPLLTYTTFLEKYYRLFFKKKYFFCGIQTKAGTSCPAFVIYYIALGAACQNRHKRRVSSLRPGKEMLFAPKYNYRSSFASASICAVLSSFSAERMVTVVSVKVMFLLFSNIALIAFAAVGAQEPFSITPITRF